jgi:hypothetical protein
MPRFKRLSREEFLALDEARREDYRYGLERLERRERAIWFWAIGACLVGALAAVSDAGIRIGLIGALGLWIVFLAIK